jgi:hypothetical protein
MCPFGDGRHHRRLWQDVKANRSGQVCIRCSKTWEWVGDELFETYKLREMRRYRYTIQRLDKVLEPDTTNSN